MIQDFRFAFRSLLKSPAFTLIAVVTLALGIGMNTAIFSLIYDLFLRGLPFAHPDRIVRVYGEAKDRNLQQMPFSVPRFWHYRDGQTFFSEFAADAGTGFIMTGLGDPVQLNGADVTANYFKLLGVSPIRGRLFLPNEEQNADVALISEKFWRHRLDGDPNAVGRSVTLNGIATTIVGILPNQPVAWWGPDLEVWTTKPFQLPGVSRDLLMRGVSYMRAIGRLKPGVTIEQTRAALVPLQQSYRAQNPEKADNSWEPTAVSAAEDIAGNLRPAFITLLAAVAFVLLIACSNVANLLLVRFSGRRREIALRMAIGASRTGIVRLFVMESTLVSLIAGGLGLLLAVWVVSFVPRLAGNNLPFESSIELHPGVLFFTLAIALLTGIAMGLYPAWQSSKADLVDGLKDGGRAISGSVGQQRFRRILVTAQVCLSVVLLTGASLLIASFVRLSKQEAGFRSDRLWVGGIGLPPASYADAAARSRFADRLQKELSDAPGVQAVALGDAVPLNGNQTQSPYARVDRNPAPMNQRPLGPMRSVMPGYFQTLGIPILAGRDFNEHDSEDRPLVVAISQSTAKRLFPNENPIGHSFFFGTQNGTGASCEVVAVVGDVRSFQLAKANDVEFYRPWPQRNFPFITVSVRTAIKPEAATSIVRAALNKVDPALPIIQPQTMDEIVSASLGQQRLTMSLLGVFAGVALLLAVVGIYGAVAYTVEQRTGEIGVRMALGAQARDVLQLILSQGMKPVFIGLIVGIAVALALGRLLKSQLYQVSAHSPALLAVTTFILAAVALAACLIPARRATQVNPIIALRYE
jgi:putative ABC transport system permease protein